MHTFCSISKILYNKHLNNFLYQKINIYYTNTLLHANILTDVVGKYFWIYMQ